MKYFQMYSDVLIIFTYFIAQPGNYFNTLYMVIGNGIVYSLRVYSSE